MGVMASPPPPARKFLVIADETPECALAIRFAAQRAAHSGGRVTILRILAPGDFQHWMAVEERMRDEAWEEAESLVHRLAGQVNEITGQVPEVIIRDGKPRETIIALLKEDPAIAIIVLAAGVDKEGPGPLVTLATRDPSNAYPIPVTIVPGVLTEDQIDALT
jgi:nucleotide-binding universal stress UspA family protein